MSLIALMVSAGTARTVAVGFIDERFPDATIDSRRFLFAFELTEQQRIGAQDTIHLLVGNLGIAGDTHNPLI